MAGNKTVLFAMVAGLAATGVAFALRRKAAGSSSAPPAPPTPPPGGDGDEYGGDYGGGKAVLVPDSLPTATVTVISASGYTYQPEAKLAALYAPKRTGDKNILSVGPYDSVRIQWGWGVRNTGTAPGSIALQAQFIQDSALGDSIFFNVQPAGIHGFEPHVIKDVDRTVNPVTVYPGQSLHAFIGIEIGAKALLDSQTGFFNWWVSKLYLYDYFNGDADHPLKMTSGQDAIDTLRDWFKLQLVPGAVAAEPTLTPAAIAWL